MIIKYPKKLLEKLKRYPSKAVIWISLLIIFAINIQYQNWDRENKIIAWDVNHYYAYLPMVFIYNDIDMDFISQGGERMTKHYWPIVTAKGKRAVMVSMGLAYLYSPFFLAGHGIAQLTPYAGDEFSPPYKIALILSCLFYFTIGLIFLRKVLRRYYSELVTGISLLLIVFGTNLFHYLTEEPTMTHAYNFALISVFIFLITKWLQRPGIKYALLIGVMAGLIALIRPSNIIVVLLLVFWGVSSARELGSRISFYFRNFHLVGIMIIGFILVWLPQIIYWHHVSGSLFLYTYGSSGQGFFFDNPQVYHLLFSYRKGWFVYTPLMFVALFGFYFLYKNNKGLFWPIIIYLAINTYILASWWSWWNGGSFGLRSFIDMYGLMAFPLAALLTFFLKQRSLIMIPALLILAALLYLNLFQATQNRNGALHYTMMTKKSYWDVFLDMTPPQSYWDNLVYPDYEAAKQGIYYSKTEIPYGLEKQLGMRGWQYLNKLKDSISNQPDRLEEIIRNNTKSAPIDSLIQIEAMSIFNKIIDNYYKEKP
ncbi:MAG: hypothetical protein DRI83_00045 [Bacteroidetes bacterium]|nr:MAG: hypothetical protein DRI83_00045 [Bacteroidota bacterium]